MSSALSPVGFETYRRLLLEFTGLLREKFAAGLHSVALFGSVARGEARPDSDVDLLVVLENDCYREEWERQLDDRDKSALRQAEDAIERSEEDRRLREGGYKPDLFPVMMSEEEIWERPHVLLDIQDHGVILYDDGTLQKRFEALRQRLKELGAKKVVLEDGKWYWDLKPDWKPGEVIEL